MVRGMKPAACDRDREWTLGIRRITGSILKGVLVLTALLAIRACSGMTAAQNRLPDYSESIDDDLNMTGPMEDIVDEPDELERMNDMIWTFMPTVQANWSWRSDGARVTHLGAPIGWQARVGMSPNRIQLGFLADKDMGEPWGSGDAPWSGPELKRWFVSRDGDRFDILLGGLRIQHGFGLVSGRRTASLPSRSNPLRLPARLTSARGYAGAASGALRNGAMATLEGWRGVLRFWRTSDKVAAATGLGKLDNGTPVTLVRDISGTVAFVTANSLERREGVRLSSTGVQTALAGSRWQVAALSEHIEGDARSSRFPDSVSVSVIPHSTMAVSVVGRISVSRIDMISERSATSGAGSSFRTALRWSHRGSGLIVDLENVNLGRSSPFSNRGRYFSAYKRETTLRTAGRWRRPGGSDWSFRGAMRHQGKGDGGNSMQQFALDWSGPLQGGHNLEDSNRLRFGVTHRRERDHDDRPVSTTRVQIRFQHPPTRVWGADIQFQLGRRTTKMGYGGITGLLGATIHRNPLSTKMSEIRPSLVPGVSSLMLIRLSSETRTVLYAVQPAPVGGFPVLSGSAPAAIMVNRLRWRPTPGVVGDLIGRVDRFLASSDPAYSFRVSLQLRIAL